MIIIRIITEYKVAEFVIVFWYVGILLVKVIDIDAIFPFTITCPLNGDTVYPDTLAIV